MWTGYLVLFGNEKIILQRICFAGLRIRETGSVLEASITDLHPVSHIGWIGESLTASQKRV
jgi:hypothetical protein